MRLCDGVSAACTRWRRRGSVPRVRLNDAIDHFAELLENGDQDLLCHDEIQLVADEAKHHLDAIVLANVLSGRLRGGGGRIADPDQTLQFSLSCDEGNGRHRSRLYLNLRP